MKEFVSVRPAQVLFSSGYLKRDALVFSRIAIPTCAASAADPLLTRLGLLEERDYLLEHNLIFDPERSHSDIFRGISSEVKTDPVSQKIQAILDAVKNDERFREQMLKELGWSNNTELGALLIQFALQFECILRPLSARLREHAQMDAYAVSTLNPQTFENPTAEKQDVLGIVLKALPIPDEHVPWEQILEFRSDPDSAGKFMALRNWMNEITRAKLSPDEIEQKLEWLIYDYTRHLEFHRMRTNVGTLEAIVVASAECLANLANLEFGKIAKGLFALRQRKLQMLEGELKSPGNEIAYIVKATTEFGEK